VLRRSVLVAARATAAAAAAAGPTPRLLTAALVRMASRSVESLSYSSVAKRAKPSVYK